MLNPYRLIEANEVSKKLAEEITVLVISRAVTYKEAEDALEVSQELLMSQTRPTKV